MVAVAVAPPKRLLPEGAAVVVAAGVVPKGDGAEVVAAGAVVAGAAAEDAGAALDAGVGGAPPFRPPKRLPVGAAAGFAPKREGPDDVGAAAGVPAGPLVAPGAGVELDDVVAAGVPPRPENNEPPAFGCSGALNAPNNPPEGGCDEPVAGAVDAGGAGVVDCEAAGVLDAGWPKRLPAGFSDGVAGFAPPPKRLDDPVDCPAPPNRFEEPLAGAGVVEPNNDLGCEPAVAPPPNRDCPPAAGALELGGGAAGVVEPRLPKLNVCVFGAAGVVEGCELPPPPKRPPDAGAVLPPPPPNNPPDGALDAGGLFSPAGFAPNSPPLPPALAPAPPNSPLPPPPDVAVFPNEKVGLLVADEEALFVVLPNSPPPPPGVLPVDAPNGLAALAGLLPPPPNRPPDAGWVPDEPEPKRPPPEPDVAPPKGEALLPDVPGVPPKLKAMLAQGSCLRCAQ